MKSGIGSYAVQVGPLQVGAVVAVNALGDIYDSEAGRKVLDSLQTTGKLSWTPSCSHYKILM